MAAHFTFKAKEHQCHRVGRSGKIISLDGGWHCRMHGDNFEGCHIRRFCGRAVYLVARNAFIGRSRRLLSDRKMPTRRIRQVPEAVDAIRGVELCRKELEKWPLRSARPADRGCHLCYTNGLIWPGACLLVRRTRQGLREFCGPCQRHRNSDDCLSSLR
jgi:hypothetical protein